MATIISLASELHGTSRLQLVTADKEAPLHETIRSVRSISHGMSVHRKSHVMSGTFTQSALPTCRYSACNTHLLHCHSQLKLATGHCLSRLNIALPSTRHIRTLGPRRT